jgi:magnesium-transporting ATPase (P-type)
LTGFFAFFVFLGLFNCFNSRSDRLNIFSGLGKNAAFVLIICSVAFVQLIFTYVGGSILRTVPLTASELWFSLSMALAAIPAGIAHTLWRRLRGKRDGF